MRTAEEGRVRKREKEENSEEIMKGEREGSGGGNKKGMFRRNK